MDKDTIPEEVRALARAMTTASEDELAETLWNACRGAAAAANDQAVEHCATSLLSVITEVRAAFPVPPGQVAMAPVEAVFGLLTRCAAAFRMLKIDT